MKLNEAIKSVIDFFLSLAQNFSSDSVLKKEYENKIRALKLQLSDALAEGESWHALWFSKNAQVNQLQKELEIYNTQPIPKLSGQVSYSELTAAFSGKTQKLLLSDMVYDLIDKASMIEFLAWDKTNDYKYTANYFDCDDFSYRLMGQASTPAWAGIAFGIAWSTTHAFNVFMASDKKIYIIEPQSDKIIPLEQAQGAYANLQVVMI